MMPSSGFPRRWLQVLNDFGLQRLSGLRWQLWFLQLPDLRLLWCPARLPAFLLYRHPAVLSHIKSMELTLFECAVFIC